jgi:hypothetical protein
MPDRARRIESVAAALVLAAAAAGVALAASGLRGDAGDFPRLVATLTALFALGEAAVRALAREPYGAPPPADPATRRRALLLLGWFAAALAGIYLLGIVIATALFTAAYFRLFADWRTLPAAAAGIALAAAFHLGFGVLAGFRLHEGVISLLQP